MDKSILGGKPPKPPFRVFDVSFAHVRGRPPKTPQIVGMSMRFLTLFLKVYDYNLCSAGGISALMGCIFLGRKTKYNIDTQGHNKSTIALSVIGGSFLLVGFLAFNGGCILKIVSLGEAFMVLFWI